MKTEVQIRTRIESYKRQRDGWKANKIKSIAAEYQDVNDELEWVLEDDT